MTEVLKEWKDEPEFQDLLVWNPQTDQLEPTSALLQGKSVFLKQILKVSKGYKDYNDILKEVELRAWAKEQSVRYANQPQKLEAKYISPMNVAFTKLFGTILPLESDKNMQVFKRRYLEEVKRIFRLPMTTTVAEKKKTIVNDEHLVHEKTAAYVAIDELKEKFHIKKGG